MLNDQPYLFQNKANTLEKIAHQYHMHEIYEKAAVIYNDLVENPPNNVNGICACANDLTENGVMTEVVNIARQLKHFGVKSFGYDYGRVPSSAARGVQAKLYGRSPSSAARGDFGDLSYNYGRGPWPLNFGKRSADIHDEKENTKALINNYLAHSTKVENYFFF